MTTQQNQAFVPCVRGIDRPRAFHTTSDPKLCRTHGRSRLERGAGGVDKRSLLQWQAGRWSSSQAHHTKGQSLKTPCSVGVVG